jgi:hypothetical protein
MASVSDLSSAWAMQARSRMRTARRELGSLPSVLAAHRTHTIKRLNTLPPGAGQEGIMNRIRNTLESVRSLARAVLRLIQRMNVSFFLKLLGDLTDEEKIGIFDTLITHRVVLLPVWLR